MRSPNGKSTSVDRGGRDGWESTIHLDGRPVDRYTIGSGKRTRPHRLLKGAKGSSSPLVEEAVGKDRVGGCTLSKKKPPKNPICGSAFAFLRTSVCSLFLSLLHFLSSSSLSRCSTHTHLFHIQGQLL